MANKTQTQYVELLNRLAEELDISPTKYQQAVQRYNSVGEWLKEGDYYDLEGELYIYPQGSFRLGTVVRPFKEGKDADYDIDLVCQLPPKKDSILPKKVKSIVGGRLKEHGTYKEMLEKEGRRCWTLNYKEEDGIGFHLDVLPAIPDDPLKINETYWHQESNTTSIAITDKRDENTYQWSFSDPNGYADWFDNKNKESFSMIVLSEKKKLFEGNRELFEKIDDVPKQLVKTPLQRTIQLLKRHRDIRFAGHSWESDKPISMIITTLSAHLYAGEVDTYSALKNIVEKLSDYVQLLNPTKAINEMSLNRELIDKMSDGSWYIPNPVNPDENFADKWHENGSRKARMFFDWVSGVKEDLIEILNGSDLKNIKEALKPCFGDTVVSTASNKMLMSGVLSVQGQKAPHVVINKPNKPYSDYGSNF